MILFIFGEILQLLPFPVFSCTLFPYCPETVPKYRLHVSPMLELKTQLALQVSETELKKQSRNANWYSVRKQAI